MNDARFREVQKAVDQELLEDAQRVRNTHRGILGVTALAACACIALFTLAARIWVPSGVENGEAKLASTVTEEAAAVEKSVAAEEESAKKKATRAIHDESAAVEESTVMMASCVLENTPATVSSMETTVTDAEELFAANPLQNQCEYVCRERSTVGQCPAYLAYNEGKDGQIFWLDTEAGRFYALTVETNAAPDTLIRMALSCMRPE